MAMPLSSCNYFNWESTSLLQDTMMKNEPDMIGSYFSYFHEEPPSLLPTYCSDYDTLVFLNESTNNNYHYNNNESSFLFDYCHSEPTYPPQQQQQYHSSLSSAYEYDDDAFQYPKVKRQRTLSYADNCNHHQLPSYHHNNDSYLFYDGFGDNFSSTNNNNANCCHHHNHHHHPSYSSSLVPEFNGVIGVPPPAVPAVSDDEKKWSGEEVVVKERAVSAQSVAARETRKKIAEKTEELGKIVPGGSKMNTADMLLSASKYVKYLQAQVSMLQLMNNNTQLMEDMASTLSEDQDGELKAMLGNTGVEEQLYLQEKCLVPQKLVTSLTNHSNIKTRPSILKDLNQLIVSATDTEKKQL